MNVALLSSSHYLHAVGVSPLPGLDEALRAACREQHRRVDRFIQLTLLGAARCAAGRTLGPDCALYLGSGVGPESNNIVVQEQICRDHLLPRPFNFVNTLGSSATFFVAKDRALTGQGWWASRRGATLEALLELALADMELGLCNSALVGVVEECPAPYEEHRRRTQVGEGVPLAEGSHWLLIEAQGPADAGSLALTQGAEAWDAAALRADWRSGDHLAFGPGLPAERRQVLMASVTAAPFGEDLPWHDSLAFSRATAWLQSKEKGRLHLLCGGPRQFIRLTLSAPV